MNVIFPLFCVVLAAAMAELLIPEEGGAGTKKVLRLLTALAVLLLILSPLTSLLKKETELPLPSAGETPDFEAVFAGAMDAAGKAEFEARLRAALAAKFGTGEECFALTVRYEEEEPAEVFVVLSGKGLTIDPREAETYLTELLRLPAQVR